MLKIKDNVDLKELEKFGFKYYEIVRQNNNNPKFYNGFKTFFETGYIWDDGINTVKVIIERINSNWNFPNQEREIYVFESDYERGVSDDMIDLLFDLIQAGLVEKF